MKIQENSIAAGQIIGNLAERMDRDRGEEVHVSELIFCLRKAWLQRHGHKITPDYDSILVFSVGLAMQAWLTGQLGDDVPVDLLGIVGTPDYIDPDGVINELKATYASAGRDITGTPHYFDQLASYAIMKGQTKGRLVVFYVNGYYNFQRKVKIGTNERAVLKVFDVEWEQEELDEWWEEMQERKDVLLNATSIEEIPLDLHYSWECGYCPFKDVLCPGGGGRLEGRW